MREYGGVFRALVNFCSLHCDDVSDEVDYDFL